MIIIVTIITMTAFIIVIILTFNHTILILSDFFYYDMQTAPNLDIYFTKAKHDRYKNNSTYNVKIITR